MTTDETERAGTNDYAISHRPVVPARPGPASDAADYENLGELSRRPGPPVLFAIARDPHTIFAFWEVDWPNTFGDNPPPDRKVFLRVLSADGLAETTSAVEPLAGNHSVAVEKTGDAYRLELGYHAAHGAWNRVALSEPVTTPPDGVAQDASIDVATVPFHLSFQRLVDSFRGSRYDGEAIVEVMARLQERADRSATPLTFTGDDGELLRAIESSLSDSAQLERATLREAPSHFSSRRRLEAILGFGATSRR